MTSTASLVAPPVGTTDTVARGLLPGHLVGGCRLRELHAVGGMGTIWRATGPDGTEVAVKVVRPTIAADPLARERFRREVDAMSRLHGLHTPRLLGADPDGPVPYLVMPYLEGRTLKQRIVADGPLDGPESVEFARDLAAALVDVHGAGLVHRDVKPANVLLTDEGPVLIDFGIAHGLHELALTAVGSVMGSPGWTAPELLAGERATPAADVFCWGAAVAHATTGRHPWGLGSTYATLYRVQHEEPDLDGAPSELSGLLRWAMSPNPLHRPSAANLLEALDDVVARQDRRARRVRVAKAAAWVGGGLLVGAVGGAGAAAVALL